MKVFITRINSILHPPVEIDDLICKGEYMIKD